MNISDLPVELQELCHKRQKEQGNNGTFTGALARGRGSSNFDWKDTPEGDQFWRDLDNGRDVTKHEMYPKPVENYSIY